MSLNMLSDFMQVLNIKRKHPTKDEYFPKHILITTIYLLQKQKLVHNNYYEQNIKMRYFIQAKEYAMNMPVMLQGMNMHGFL
jgi:hypothetical protein